MLNIVQCEGFGSRGGLRLEKSVNVEERYLANFSDAFIDCDRSGRRYRYLRVGYDVHWFADTTGRSVSEIGEHILGAWIHHCGH